MVKSRVALFLTKLGDVDELAKAMRDNIKDELDSIDVTSVHNSVISVSYLDNSLDIFWSKEDGDDNNIKSSFLIGVSKISRIQWVIIGCCAGSLLLVPMIGCYSHWKNLEVEFTHTNLDSNMIRENESEAREFAQFESQGEFEVPQNGCLYSPGEDEVDELFSFENRRNAKEESDFCETDSQEQEQDQANIPTETINNIAHEETGYTAAPTEILAQIQDPNTVRFDSEIEYRESENTLTPEEIISQLQASTPSEFESQIGNGNAIFVENTGTPIKTSADAVLSCPRCFQIVCTNGQRRTHFPNQYLAGSVTNVSICWSVLMDPERIHCLPKSASKSIGAMEDISLSDLTGDESDTLHFKPNDIHPSISSVTHSEDHLATLMPSVFHCNGDSDSDEAVPKSSARMLCSAVRDQFQMEGSAQTSPSNSVLEREGEIEEQYDVESLISTPKAGHNRTLMEEVETKLGGEDTVDVYYSVVCDNCRTEVAAIDLTGEKAKFIFFGCLEKRVNIEN